jgi:HPr kinase/phosphorylase
MKVAPKPIYIHATAIAIAGHGILISGQSKAGKSTLAENLIAAALALGRSATLIGDDRIGLTEQSGRMMLAPHPAIAGMIERRGTGIVSVPYCMEAPAVFEIALSSGREPGATRFERLPGLILPGVVARPCPDASAILPLVLAALPQ